MCYSDTDWTPYQTEIEEKRHPHTRNFQQLSLKICIPLFKNDYYIIRLHAFKK